MSLPLRGAAPDARLRLFCFPYAGAAAIVYRGWIGRLGSGIDVLPVEYPGRGTRRRESLIPRLTALVEVLAEDLRPALDRPFALFGHSFGSLVAYELARRLRRRGAAMPLVLFVSGCGAPHTRILKAARHDAPVYTVRERLKELGGTPQEALDNDELMELVLPIVRADFAAIETYRHREEPPLPCPIRVFAGAADPEVSFERSAAWRNHTAGDFSLALLPGGHFFLHSDEAQLLGLLNRALTDVALG